MSHLAAYYETHRGQVTSDEDVYNELLEAARAGGFLDDKDASFAQLSVAMHRYSAAIQAQYQYFETKFQHENAVESCDNVLFYGGVATCDPGAAFAFKSGTQDVNLDHLSTDRVFGASSDAPTAVLYADVLSDTFPTFHESLMASAETGKIKYVLRYKPSASLPADRETLSGYGVEVNLKRTDYLVVDDRKKPAKGGEQTALTLNLEEGAVVAKEDLPTLGYRAATFIKNSEDLVGALQNASLNFPLFSSSISEYPYDEQLMEEAALNAEDGYFPPGKNAILLNGAPFGEHDDSIFALLEAIDRERSFVKTVSEAAGVDEEASGKLIRENIIGLAHANSSTRERYDYRTSGLVWLTDLETDSMFATWSRDLKDYLKDVGEGDLPRIARNTFSIVFAIDLGRQSHLNALSQGLGMLARRVPLQVGVIPLMTSEQGRHNARLLSYLKHHGRPGAAQALVVGLLQSQPLETVLSRVLPPSFNEMLLSTDEKIQADVLALQEWSSRFDSRNDALVFADGYLLDTSSMTWLYDAFNVVQSDLSVIREAVDSGELADTDTPRDFLLRDAYKTRHGSIEARGFDVPHVSMSDIYEALGDDVFSLEIAGDAETFSSLWIVFDESQRRGLQQLLEVLDYMSSAVSSKSIRLNIVPVGEQPNTERLKLLSYLSRLDVSSAFTALSEYMQSGMLVGEASEISVDEKLPQRAREALAPHLKLKAPLQLVLDGRVIRLPLSSRLLDVDSLALLFSREQEYRTRPILSAVAEILKESIGDRADRFKFADSLVSAYSKTYYKSQPSDIFKSLMPPRVHSSTWHDTHSGRAIGNPDEPLHALVVLDPLSDDGQHYAAYVEALSKLPVYVKVLLNPVKYSTEDKVPLKRYYKAAFPVAPAFDESGKLHNDRVTFDTLPQTTLLWLGLTTPHGWGAAPSASEYDLDNIILRDVSDDVLSATYELEHLLLEGHAQDATVGGVPRGLALNLATFSSEPYVTDTSVMANLGYFQLKANPGLYKLEIKPGHHRNVYNLDTAGSLASEGPGADLVYITDMRGATILPEFSRKKGMEDADVLQPPAPSWTEKAFSIFGGSQPAKPKNADINIFTVASGHLYERFLSIMTASVMNHTDSTVKFWLIENFLSPTFKSFLPELAEKYGFDYELVTYKWPHWLRGQAEKQREIWGYKILFLDVLFPQDLDKVIFVDADQIVRTDMKELVDLDLEGAPYGFTPMCDSRQEMEGFRFWKQGYWKKYLNGMPYHISALFVVDLKRFRELATGDLLRDHYQALSADPASLSNLDQDLPNHLQKLVPIHSLPQEWLWCETWCSDEALKTAKTIDLCNNPLTKEPKLDRARRQIPEWVNYDNAVTDLMTAFRAKAQPVQAGHEEKAIEEDGTPAVEFEVEHDDL